MTVIRQAAPQDFVVVRELFAQHLELASAGVYRTFQVSFDTAPILEQDMADIGKFMPPSGRLFLALEQGEMAGCACVRTTGVGMAELKRMYVRPEWRRKGLGRKLVQTLIDDLSGAGYTLMRLESAPFQQEAHALYRSLGFKDIAPYPENEIPSEFHGNWVFMELRL